MMEVTLVKQDIHTFMVFCLFLSPDGYQRAASCPSLLQCSALLLLILSFVLDTWTTHRGTYRACRQLGDVTVVGSRKLAASLGVVVGPIGGKVGLKGHRLEVELF